MTSDFKQEVVISSQLRMRREKSPKRRKTASDNQNVHVMKEIGVAEFIFGEIFAA